MTGKRSSVLQKRNPATYNMKEKTNHFGSFRKNAMQRPTTLIKQSLGCPSLAITKGMDAKTNKKS